MSNKFAKSSKKSVTLYPLQHPIIKSRMKRKYRYPAKTGRRKSLPIPQLRKRRTRHAIYPQHPATKRSRPLQRMDRSRTRTKRTPAIHRHESPKQNTTQPCTSTTDRRSAAGALKTGNKYCCQSAVKNKIRIVPDKIPD